MKVLFLAQAFPYPTNDGGRIRIYHMLRALAERHEVTFAGLQDDDDQTFSQAVQELDGFCSRVVRLGRRIRSNGTGPKNSWHRWWRDGLGHAMSSPLPELLRGAEHEASRSLRELLHTVSFDACHFGGFGTLRYLLAVAEAPTPMYLSLDLSDIESVKEKRQLRLLPTRRLLSEWRLARQLDWVKLVYWERRLLKKFELCTVCSEVDQRLLRQRKIARDTLVVPNGVDTSYFQPTSHRDETEWQIGFFGNMSYEPNVDGIQYFCRDIFPSVKRVMPAVSLKIVGKAPAVGVQECHNGRDIVVTGTVNDVRPYLEESAVAVVPLRIGGGTRLKILEAMSMGKAVVSTSVGCEGLAVTHGENILISDDPREFAQACLDVLRDPTLRRRLGDAARRLVCERYDWEQIRARLADDYGPGTIGALKMKFDNTGLN